MQLNRQDPRVYGVSEGMCLFLAPTIELLYREMLYKVHKLYVKLKNCTVKVVVVSIMFLTMQNKLFLSYDFPSTIF